MLPNVPASTGRRRGISSLVIQQWLGGCVSLLLASFLFGAEAEAACAAPVAAAEVEKILQKAEAAYADLDVDVFEGAVDEGAEKLPCLAEPISTAIAAHVHRMEGLRRYTDRDPDKAREAWATARELEPIYSFPDSLIPAKHAIRDAYRAASPIPGTASLLPAPAVGYLLFDGTRATQRSPGRATIFQVVGDGGKIVSSAYLYSSDSPTAYATAVASAATGKPETKKGPAEETVGPIPPTSPAAPAATGTKRAPEATNTPTTKSGERHLARPILLGSAAASAVVAGSFYALSFVPRQQFDENNPSDTLADLNRYQSQAKNRTFAAAGFGTVAAGLVVGGVFVGTW